MATKREFAKRKQLSIVPSAEPAISKYKEVVPEGESFDITSLTLEQLARDIKSAYDKKEPVSIFFRRRQTKKLVLDNERQALLLERVSWLRRQGAELMAMRADAILSERTFVLLIERREREAQEEIKRAISAHELGLHQDSTDIQILDARVRVFNAQAKKVEQENDDAAVNLKFKKDFFKDIDIDSLPPALRTHIISKLIDGGSSSYGDFERDEILRDHLNKQLEEENRKREYEADSLKSQSEIERSSADVSISDFKRSLKKDD